MRLLLYNLAPRALRLSCAVMFCVGISLAQSPAPSPSPVLHKEIKRWVDIETLSIASRYRYVHTDAGITASILQYQVAARGRFKFDPKGKYSVVGVLWTGSNIQSGWNLTGWGTGDFQGDFPVKQLYFEAKPNKQIEVQVGGIAPYIGEHTEITTYDGDSYLTGERLRIKYPKKLYFDEVSATTAFVGDITKPNVFRRFKRLGEWNYFQFMVRKELNKRISFSADYAYEAGADTLRQAVKVNAPELKIADSVRFENYQRIDPNPGYGFALSAEKKANKNLSLIYGISDINHALLNGDRYPRGTRLYFLAAYKVTAELSVGSAFIQAVGPLDSPTLPRTRLDIIASYNILEALKHYKIF